MYALVSGDQLVKYPVSLFQWRVDNPLVSLPSEPTEEQLNEQGLYSVKTSRPPIYDYSVNLEETAELNEDGEWQQAWIETPASEAEITARTAEKAAEVRKERNEKLAACDWTQLSDAPVSGNAWTEYRAALRDVPSQEGFPWEINWPIPPAS